VPLINVASSEVFSSGDLHGLIWCGNKKG